MVVPERSSGHDALGGKVTSSPCGPPAVQTYLTLEYGHRSSLPPGHADEVRTPPVLVDRLLEEFTTTGDRVLDPFAGYGTTLVAAERLDRIPFGIEYEDGRANYVRERLNDAELTANVRHGDVLQLEGSWFPPIDCCLTSPPFMAEGHTENPFENYAGESTYADYLDDMERAFRNVRDVLTPGGTVLVDISNLKNDGHVTTLAWDVADRLREVFRFDGEVVVGWSDPEPHRRDGEFGYGYDHSYVLVFENEEE